MKYNDHYFLNTILFSTKHKYQEHSKLNLKHTLSYKHIINYIQIAKYTYNM